MEMLTNGNVISKKTENCYFHSENKLLVSLGLKDLVIINTDDATLVADKNQSENIKNIVANYKLKILKKLIFIKKVIDHGVFI